MKAWLQPAFAGGALGLIALALWSGIDGDMPTARAQMTNALILLVLARQ